MNGDSEKVVADVVEETKTAVTSNGDVHDKSAEPAVVEEKKDEQEKTEEPESAEKKDEAEAAEKAEEGEKAPEEEKKKKMTIKDKLKKTFSMRALTHKKKVPKDSAAADETAEEEKIEGIDSSKVVRTDEEKIKEEKKNQKVIEDLRQKLKEVLSNIVENIVKISEINNCESDNIITTLEMIDEKGYCVEVVFEVGLDFQTVKKIILTGALSEKLLNTIITSYNKEEKTVSL